MKKIYTLAALAMVAIVACNKEVEAPEIIDELMIEEPQVVNTDGPVITALAPLETKTTVDGLDVKWATGDHIAVFDATKAAHDYTLATGDGETTATFTGSLGGSTELGFAVYPFSAYAAITDDPYFSVDYVTTFPYANVKVPMWGSESAGKYAFEHVGGAFKISYTNVPSAAEYFYFQSSADDITGTALFDGTDSVIAANDGDAVMVTDLPSSSSLDFIIPVPAEAAGTAYTFTVSLLDSSMDEIPGSVKTVSSAKTVQLGHLKPLKAINMKADKNEVMWSEDFSSYAAEAVPGVGEGDGWRGTVIDYSLSGSGKVYAEALADGTSPEILVQQSGGTFTVSGIPTGGWDELSLSYKSNKELGVSATESVTVGDAANAGTLYVRKLTIPSGVTKFNLTFTKTGTGNARLDDIVITASADPSALVYSKEASGITSSSATLNGNILLINSGVIGSVSAAGFYYKKTADSKYTKVNVDTPLATTNFSKNLTGLDAVQYSFYAFAEYDGGDEITGNIKTFTPANGELLPFDWDGGKADGTSYMTIAAGSDYASSPKVKFQTANSHYIIVQIATAASEVSFSGKCNGTADANKVKLQGSVNGSSYTDIEEFTIASGTNTYTSTESINSSYRFLKLVLSVKGTGTNTAMGSIHIE